MMMRVAAGAHTRSTRKKPDLLSSTIKKPVETSVKPRKIAAKDASVWKSQIGDVSYTYRKEDYINASTQEVNTRRKTAFKSAYRTVMRGSPQKAVFQFKSGEFALYSREGLPKWAKDALTARASHNCKTDVSPDYVKHALEQCDYVLLQFVVEGPTVTATTRLRDQSLVSTTKQLTVKRPTVLAFALLKKMPIKASAFELVDDFDVDYIMSRDAFMYSVVHLNMYKYTYVVSRNAQTGRRITINSKPELTNFPDRPPKSGKVSLYIDVICSAYKQGGAILKILENSEFRRKIKDVLSYDSISLRGIPSVYSYYLGQGYVKTVDYETFYPAYYHDDGRVIYTVDREMAKLCAKDKSLHIMNVFKDDLGGETNGYFLSKFLPLI
jgi:hypothetical protein